MGENSMAAAHVIIDICVKDITEVLIVWVSFCLNLRLQELTMSKSDGRSVGKTDRSYMNMIASRVPRNRTMFESLDEDNTDGMLSQVRLPSVAFLNSRKQFNADRTVKKVDKHHAPPPSKGHSVYLEKTDEMADTTPVSSARVVANLDKEEAPAPRRNK